MFFKVAIILFSVSSWVLAPVAARPEIIRTYNTIEPAESHNERCNRLNSQLALPDPAGGCCGRDKYATNLEDRILNGNESGLYQFPWLVRLQTVNDAEFDYYSCSGVLIGAQYLLTAGHCTSPSNVINKIGFGCPANNVDTSKCLIEMQHPGRAVGYTSTGFILYKLKKTIEYTDHVRPICLPRETLASLVRGEETVELVVAGWGRTDSSDEDSESLEKMYTCVPYVPAARCNEMLMQGGHAAIDEEKEICAGGDSSGRDVCHGDSGGALMYQHPGGRHDLFGIIDGLSAEGYTSCGVQTVPSSYINVSSHYGWILDNVESGCNLNCTGGH